MKYLILLLVGCCLQAVSHAQAPDKAILDGNLIARKNYGMANLEHAIPFTHTSPVRLVYSMGRE